MDMEKTIERAELDYGLDDIAATVRGCRSYRRFDDGDPIPRELMLALVDLARQTASAGNLQPLRYRLVSDASVRDGVFERLGWAGYLATWDGPELAERPTGYIVVCAADKVTPLTWVDAGIASQTILLSATEAGFGGCILRNFKPDLAEFLSLDGVEPLVVIALGTPVEKCVLEPLDGSPDGIKYWRDDQGVHHVPKRSLEEVLV